MYFENPATVPKSMHTKPQPLDLATIWGSNSWEKIGEEEGREFVIKTGNQIPVFPSTVT